MSTWFKKTMKRFGYVSSEDVTKLIRDNKAFTSNIELDDKLIAFYQQKIAEKDELTKTQKIVLDKIEKEKKTLNGLVQSKDEANSNLIREVRQLEHQINVLEGELLRDIPKEEILEEIRRISNSLYSLSGTQIMVEGFGNVAVVDKMGNISISKSSVEYLHHPITLTLSIEDPTVIIRAAGESEREYYWRQFVAEFVLSLEQKILGLVLENRQKYKRIK